MSVQTRRRRQARPIFAILAASLAALILAAAFAGAAAAQVVYVHDDDVYVMNDDGSGARALADNTSLGMSSLSEPHATLDGSSVYFSGSTSLYASRNPSTGYISSGFWAVGAYRWTLAGPTRLSPPPAVCPSYCSTFDTDAAPTAAGSFATVESLYGEGSSDSRISVGDPAAVVTSACEPYSAAPDPANAALFAYVCDEGEPSVRITSGDPASEVTARTTTGIGYSYGLSTPAWRTDGARLALAENSAIAESTQPSRIATFGPDGSDPRIAVESADPAVSFDTPTFLGGDRLAFTAIREVPGAEPSTDIWSVPATCQGCSFPLAATRITADGVSADPSYTPGTVPSQAAPVTPAPTPPSPPAPRKPGGPKGSKSPVLKAAALTGKAAPRRGFAIRLQLAAPATVKFEVVRLAKKAKRIGTLSRKLKKGSATVKFTKVGKTTLKRGPYRVTVKVPGTEGTQNVKVRAR